MKQFSNISSIVLLIAVAVLYYLHFSGSKKTAVNTLSSKVLVSDSSNHASRPVIAYVELDSVKEKVSFIKDREKELEQEQKKIISEYESQMQGIENEANNFRKRTTPATQQEVEAMQAKLGQKQQEVEQEKQTKAQQLADRGSKVMEDMQKKLRAFLNDYNKDKQYTYILATGTGLDYLFYKDSTLDITNDVITQMNEKMKNSK